MNRIVEMTKSILILLIPTAIVPFILLYFSTIFNPPCYFEFTLGLLFILFGGILFFYTVNLFKKYGDKSFLPWGSLKKLLTIPPYSYVRNPMNLGILFILLGESLVLNSIILSLWTILFFIISNIYLIFVEEKSLVNIFGKDYLEYRKNVPRWIPKIEKQ